MGDLPQQSSSGMDNSLNNAVLQILDREFADLIDNLRALTNSVPPALLYEHPPQVSIGENILRSAAVVEQVCGGLTVNLWDDPFEWTLPETLPDAGRIGSYLDEVHESRRRAFDSFADDKALSKYVAVPSGERRPLVSILLEALTRAADYRGRAFATVKILSANGATRFII